jgi:hypothetical protein
MANNFREIINLLKRDWATNPFFVLLFKSKNENNYKKHMSSTIILSNKCQKLSYFKSKNEINTSATEIKKNNRP